MARGHAVTALAWPLRAVFAAVTAALLAGCGATVKLLPEPLDCPVPAELLAQRCAEPQAVADGATYEQVLRAGGQDRDALRRCALHDQTVVQALRACNAAIARHREALRAINEQVVR